MAKMVETSWGRQPVDYNDPARTSGPNHAQTYPTHLVSWAPEKRYKVEGWNDLPKGGRCTYGDAGSLEDAIEQAKRYAREGVRDSLLTDEVRKYDHYCVTELTTVAVVTTEVVYRVKET